jgi:hypothetical protein
MKLGDVFAQELTLSAEAMAHYLEIQNIMILQADAVLAYTLLMESFMDYYGNITYPDNYAGAYIGADNQLIIQLTEVSRATTAFYMNIVGSNAPIEFREVAFSSNQLWNYLNMFRETVDAPLTFLRVDTINNVAKIDLNKYDENSIHIIDTFNMINSFDTKIELDENNTTNLHAIDNFVALSVFQSKPIVLELSAPLIDMSLLRGGYGIGPLTRLNDASIGLVGYRAGSPALITTGHAFNSLNLRVYRDRRTNIGHVVSFRTGSAPG